MLLIDSIFLYAILPCISCFLNALVVIWPLILFAIFKSLLLLHASLLLAYNYYLTVISSTYIKRKVINILTVLCQNNNNNNNNNRLQIRRPRRPL